MNDPIKVVIIQNMIVPYEVPLFIALAKHPEIDLTVYFCKRRYKEREWDIFETSEYKYEILRGITFESPKVVISFNPGILNRLRTVKPDVILLSGGYIHVTMLLAFSFGKILGIPVIYRSDENKYTRAKSSWLVKLARLIEKYVTMESQALICPSRSSKQYHIEIGASPEKTFISSYTTAYDYLYLHKSREFRSRKEEIKGDLNIMEEKIILFVGRFVKRKGVIYLLEAFKKISEKLANVALVLVGSGPLFKEYEKYCQENNLKKVYFPGFVDEEEKIKYFSIADVFVLPTLKDHWGLVINEAMLCSLPIIITKVAGASEMVVPGENGMIVDEANSEQLYLALKEIMSDSNLSSKMGSSSRRIVQSSFTLDQRIEGFVSAIKYTI